MEKIDIEIKNRDKKYSIFLGNAILSELADYIRNNHESKRVVIITDTNIKKHHGKNILNVLKEIDPHLISLPPGESSKSRQTKQKIEDQMLDKGYGKDTVIIAFGGGVIGDLAGFVASTYNRGIPLIQVPTTLLAMVDSSVGGKTAINTRHGKNLIGTIWQPDAVFADLNLLDTVSKKELLNGLVEAIKMAIILDKNLFSFIEENNNNILEKDVLLHMIKRSIELKQGVVEQDAEENNLRQILNFGHTLGHALETYTNFGIRHGFCASVGIAVESKIAVLSKELSQEEENRIVSLLDSISLPTKISRNVEIDKIIRLMRADKKTKGKKPRFIILRKIGQVKTQQNEYSFEVDEDLIKKSIELSKDSC